MNPIRAGVHLNGDSSLVGQDVWFGGEVHLAK